MVVERKYIETLLQGNSLNESSLLAGFDSDGNRPNPVSLVM